jgi:repressor LexA
MIMLLAEKLKSLRTSKSLTVDALCAELGIKRGTYVHYEVGDREPNIALLKEFAGFYNVSLDELLDRPFDLNPEDGQLLDCYRSASPDDKYVVWAVLNKYRKTASDTGKIRKIRDMPLYLMPAAAGSGAFLDSTDYGTVSVGPEVPIACGFGVRISGDSMEPEYPDGHIAWVRISQEVREGEIGVFILNGDGYIKKLGSGQLLSLNPRYGPISLSEGDNLRIVGKVLAVTE